MLKSHLWHAQKPSLTCSKAISDHLKDIHLTTRWFHITLTKGFSIGETRMR